MKQRRNRSKPATSLEERLQKFADEARAAAEASRPGREREDLVKKAQHAEALAKAADRLAE
jgi:hypothetical protein